MNLQTYKYTQRDLLEGTGKLKIRRKRHGVVKSRKGVNTIADISIYMFLPEANPHCSGCLEPKPKNHNTIELKTKKIKFGVAKATGKLGMHRCGV